MAGRVPPSLIVAVVLSVLVAGGAVAAAGVLRLRADQAARAASTSANPGAAVGPSGCLLDPCRVVDAEMIGETSIELVADNGARSGRLRIGGPTSSRVIPATVTDNGVELTEDSLQCLAGGPAACLINGRLPDGRVIGQLVVGRSDNWAPGRVYVSTAGYLALANVDGDGAPEILAGQLDCADTAVAGCAGRPVHVQVFDLTGAVAGCTRNYQSVARLPGYPRVEITAKDLTQCR